MRVDAAPRLRPNLAFGRWRAAALLVRMRVVEQVETSCSTAGGKEDSNRDVFLGGAARLGGRRRGDARDRVGGGTATAWARGARVHAPRLRHRGCVADRWRLVSLVSAQSKPQFRG